MKHFLIALTLLLALAPQTDAAERVECKSFDVPMPWKVCLSTPESGSSGDLLYYLHGSGGDAKSWSNPQYHGAEIRAAWDRQGVLPPRVAAVSLGEFWLLAEKNDSEVSGLLEVFVSTIMPEVEKLLPTPPKHRLLMGVSMGGFNASQLVLKYPELFLRAVLACPAIPSVSPYAPEIEIEDFIKRTGGNAESIHSLIELAQYFFPSEADWSRASPLLLARTLLSERSPALHVSCGRQDELGFYEGAELFAQAAREQGVQEVQWEALEGPHCVLNPESIAKFLVEKVRVQRR